MAENDESSQTVSKEAFDRVVHERDDYKSQLEKAGSVLTGVKREREARNWFKDVAKVSDPDTAAQFVAPHLANVDPEKVPETLASEAFNPFVSLIKQGIAPAAPNGENAGDGATNEGGEGGDGAEGAAAASTPGDIGGFGGPNPGSGGGNVETGQQKIKPGSAEYQSLIRSNDRAKLKEMYDKGLIEEPQRGW